MGLLDGKVAIITGSGGGIGRAHALLFAKEGAKVVVNDLGGSRDGTGKSTRMADLVVDEIKKAGGQAVANYDSVATREGATNLVKTATDAFGRCDILINNAGILRDKTLLKMEDENWDLVIAVHLKGTFLCSQAFAAHVKDRAEKGDAGGRIVNTSSYAGLMGNFGQTNYAAAKAGIYGLTKVWALELAKLGITCNAIAPMAKTRMTEDIAMVPDDMKPEQISPMVLFLCSDLAKDVNGRIFGIHGQQLLEYKMLMTTGVTKAGAEFWTPQEISAKLAEIGATGAAGAPAAGGAPAAAAPVTPQQIIEKAFKRLPEVFVAAKAQGWNATIHFEIKGADDYTVKIASGVCTTEKGKQGTATCVVKTDAQTYSDIVTGKEKAEKAFMGGKITATNLGDMMKFGGAFDMKKAREMAEAEAKSAAPAAAAAAPAAASAPVGPAESIARSMKALPGAFKADGASGWKATIHFEIKGGEDWTVVVADGKADVSKGKNGTPTCVVKAGVDDYAAMVEGKMKPEQAFMTGKITATNLGDMMKFGKAFDMKKAAEIAKSGGAAPAPAAAAPAAKKPGGMNREYIGRFFPGGFSWVKGEDTKKYALATNDQNAWYLEEGRDGGIVAPPLFSVRLTKEVMFKVVTDPGLGADLLRLVHGEQDMEFLRPLRPWDLCSIRASVDGIEEKSSGELLHLGTRIYTGGELAVKMKMTMFIRGEKKADGGEKKKEEPASHGPIVFTDTIEVTKDQSLRYADASGDNNPIHVDDTVAKMAGFPGVILQGLCTMAFTSRAVVQKLLGGDPTRLRRLAVRFAKPVLMGDKITTEGWEIDASHGKKTYGFQAKREDGTIVISNGIAEVAS